MEKYGRREGLETIGLLDSNDGNRFSGQTRRSTAVFRTCIGRLSMPSEISSTPAPYSSNCGKVNFNSLGGGVRHVHPQFNWILDQTAVGEPLWTWYLENSATLMHAG